MPAVADRRAAALAALAPAALLLGFGLAGLGPVGISTDELLHREVGDRLLRYYGSWGRDDSVTTLSNARYYGGLYDLAGILLERALPRLPWHLPRHGLSVLCGALGVFFAARTATLLAGARAGLLAGLVLLLTPRWSGHALFNPKDIPFAAAYAAAAYFLVRIAGELPRPRAGSWIGFAVASGCALGVRIAGLLLPCLLLAVLGLHLASRATSKAARAPLARDAARLGAGWLAAAAATLLLAVAAWPYLQHDTFARIRETLNVATDFPFPHPILFDGEVVQPDAPGRRYLPVWLAIALPLGLQLGAALGLLVAAARRGRIVPGARPEPLAALALAALFPLAYAVARESLLYNGIRHFLFVLPPLAALAGLGWHAALARAGSPARAALACVAVLALGEPALFMLRAHPYEYTYFNPLSGGLARQSHRYESDYWHISLGPAARAIDRAAAELPPARRLHLAVNRPHRVRRRMEPLMEHADRVLFVEPGDPRAELAVVTGGPCAPQPGLERCFFVARVVRGQRPFLEIEKLPGYDELFRRPRRRGGGARERDRGVGSEGAPSS